MKRTGDYYSKMAKQKGYPARSVFKLQEIQERFHIIKPGFLILDIGASPGSWSQYCLELLAGSGKVVGVDLVEQEPAALLPARNNYRFIKGDIFDPEIVQTLAVEGPYDLVLSDAAPATSGNRTVDTEASMNIALKVLQIAGRGLKRGGCLVVKIFQGGQERSLLEALGKAFERRRAFRPRACRKGSREVFFLGFSRK